MPNHFGPPILFRFIKITIYFCVVIVSLIFLFTSIQNLRFPYGVNYGEAPIINHAIRLLRGEEIYIHNFNSPPYIVANYPPLYIILLSIFKSFFRLPFYLGGRLISFISALISGFIISIISYRLTNKYIIGAIALGLFLGHPYVITWSSVARVDLLALSFSLLGIYVILFHQGSISGILLAVILFTAAIFTRQSYLLAGPLGVSVWLYKNDKKKFYIFILVLFLVNFAAFIYLNITTENGFFMNVVIANMNDFSVDRLFSMLKNFFIIWLLVLPILFFILIDNLRKFYNRQKYTNITPPILFFLIPYLLGAFISAITVGKVGSDINYFLEIIVALILTISLILNWAEDRLINLNLVYSISILSQFLWIIIIILAVNVRIVLDRNESLGWYESLYTEIKLATDEGIVLSDDYLDMVVISGQQIYYQPFEYGQLYKAGIWDPSNLVMEIEDNKFPLIVIGGTELEKECCWPEPVSDAIANNYEITRTNQFLYLKPVE